MRSKGRESGVLSARRGWVPVTPACGRPRVLKDCMMGAGGHVKNGQRLPELKEGRGCGPENTLLGS